jgi:alkylation response protein AidB-like acyl-CoA dehydrogenase
MPVERLLPTVEAEELLALIREICAEQIAPRAAEGELLSAFPRDIVTLLGKSGLLSLPYPERFGGGDQPYEVYLQVLEEIAAAWMTLGIAVSVHSLSAYAVYAHGSDEQRAALLPDILGGQQLGAWAMSESQAGSDVAGISTRAVRDGDGYVLNGTKAWVSQGGVADFYIVFVRTGPDPKKGLSTFHLPADVDGLSFAPPEKKMGLSASPTCQLRLDDVRVPEAWRLGREGDGMKIALAALDSGRLGIAACGTGVAQAALDVAVTYATEREQFHRTIGEFQGVQFLLADMAAAVESSRATYVQAARMRDAGRAFSRQASIAKLVCTDGAMKVTTDAVQVLGGYGYTRDFPVERYMREAKVTQIFEGTNQIQRMVIGRDLLRRAVG